MTAIGFAQFTRFLTANPAVNGWAWIPAIPADALGQCEEEARESGLIHFCIWEPGAKGERLAVSGKEMYYPMLRISAGAATADYVGLDCG